ncbi:hypothetical protein PENSOL_c034G10750 [Penicillium solitum]|uniref:Uncharacterized protein n=1 Tax=Penicillium solitum TaxID=60172 RepID=A0A1V6QVD3_9EURO|nr:uncharacterized protein PENSOL_c034G10750 [Penicillium solitum]OQD93179.1 hypothetical protein PENSOL_c034G10750 [Penicillium solitum]
MERAAGEEEVDTVWADHVADLYIAVVFTCSHTCCGSGTLLITNLSRSDVAYGKAILFSGVVAP